MRIDIFITLELTNETLVVYRVTQGCSKSRSKKIGSTLRGPNYGTTVERLMFHFADIYRFESVTSCDSRLDSFVSEFDQTMIQYQLEVRQHEYHLDLNPNSLYQG